MIKTASKPYLNHIQTISKPHSNQVRNGVNTTFKPTFKPTTTPFRGCGLNGLIGLIHHIASLIASAGLEVARRAREYEKQHTVYGCVTLAHPPHVKRYYRKSFLNGTLLGEA
jgi:hypothetical protein